jgi:hypothetical protein
MNGGGRDRRPGRRGAGAGFMLIELAVAALVIAVGVLALLGVAHVGERAAGDSENETRAALFADEVFTTLRLYSDHYSQSTNRAGWLDFWLAVAAGAELPVATEGMALWHRPDENRAVICDNRLHALLWRPRPEEAILPAAATNADFAVQYRVKITAPGGQTHFDHSQTSPPPCVLWATLHVWNGVFRTHPDAFTFYTHFSDSGELP